MNKKECNVLEYKIQTKKRIKTKIVHISDIHFHKSFKVERFEVILKLVKKISPNYICITGDLIDDKYVLDNIKERKAFHKFLKDLSVISKVIIIFGNHEMRNTTKKEYDDYKKEDKEKTIKCIKEVKNIIVLDNETYLENNINFIGYTVSSNYYKDKCKNNDMFVEEFNKQKFVIKDNYNILLTHSSKDLMSKEIKNFEKIDLVLSGHTHGGLMPKWKGNNGLISPEKTLFPKNVRGLMKINSVLFIVSYGIIKLSYSAKIFKHFNFLYKMDIGVIEIN